MLIGRRRLALVALMATATSVAALAAIETATAEPAAPGAAEATKPPASPAGTAETAGAPAPAASDKTAAATPPPSPTSVSPPPPAPSPVIVAAQAALEGKSFGSRAGHPDDIAAAKAFYGTRTEPIWVERGQLTERGKSLVDTVRRAADWGLDVNDYPTPSGTSGLSPEEAGKVEAQLTLTALTYARHARGGRIEPSSVSRLFDLTPPLKDPTEIVAALASVGSVRAYLEGLHPKHEQFVRLQKALVRITGAAEPVSEVEPALAVRLPAKGATVKPGSLHPDILLLRERLEVPAAFEGQEALFDERLAEALRDFQRSQGLKPNGYLTPRTRVALNGEAAPKSNKGSEARRIIVNMERWRWMREHLGRMHVLNNVPEYTTRVFKDGRQVFKERIIVGLPDWPTPSFSAKMQSVVFNPSWGVPDGIKEKELRPRLQRAGGGGFFEELFGGGSGGRRVLEAYGLTPYYNGRPVNPDSVNWATADLRKFSFIQPPGAKNPLGFVKFLFPNSHDVYMHDTVQRELFAQSQRAYSHGCIRVQNPQRFAELLLSEDKGWSEDRVSDARHSSETVTLDNTVWVHTAYFTAYVDDTGEVSTFGDVYGLDSRVSTALGGRPVPSFENRYDDGEATASLADDAEALGLPAGNQPTQPFKPSKADKKNKKKSGTASKYRMPHDLSEAMSGLAAN